MRADVLPDGRFAVTPVRPPVPAVGLLPEPGRLTLPELLVRPEPILPVVGRLDMLPEVLPLIDPELVRPDMLPTLPCPAPPPFCIRRLIEPAEPLP